MYNPFSNQQYVCPVNQLRVAPRLTVKQQLIVFSKDSLLFLRKHSRSFVFWITIINVLMYISTLIYSEFYNKQWTCILMDFGAKFQPKIKYHYEIYRLFSPIFLHGNFLHLLLNSVSLIFLGHHLESSFQSMKIIFLYLLAGLFGNVASSIWLSSSVSIGASGGIMGLGGLWAFFSVMNLGRMGEAEKKVAFIFGLYFLGNLMIGGWGEEQKVDYAAHVGGALMGALIGYVWWTDNKMKKNLMIAAITSLYIGGIAIIFIMDTDRIKAENCT